MARRKCCAAKKSKGFAAKKPKGYAVKKLKGCAAEKSKDCAAKKSKGKFLCSEIELAVMYFLKKNLQQYDDLPYNIRGSLDRTLYFYPFNKQE